MSNHKSIRKVVYDYFAEIVLFSISKPKVAYLHAFLSCPPFTKFWKENFMYFRHKPVEYYNQSSLLISYISYVLEAMGQTGHVTKIIVGLLNKTASPNSWSSNTPTTVLVLIDVGFIWSEKAFLQMSVKLALRP